jgi:uncharacterized protein
MLFSGSLIVTFVMLKRFACALLACFAFAFLWGGAAHAQAEVNVMNPNYGRIVAAPQPASAPYRPRRRYDSNSARPPQSDAVYGPFLPDSTVPYSTQPAEARGEILVIGDSLAEALVGGIEADANLQRDVTLIRRTSSASGFVRPDLLDWPSTAAGLIAANRNAAALIIMIGLNDSQTMRVGAEAFEPFSEGWNTRYRARVNAILASAREANIPVIWVGLPPMRNTRLSADLEAITALIRHEVEAAGQSFVSTRDAFSDEDGVFSLTGPDIIGDHVRLRAQDGIHFTKAGQRKLAFFVDAPLRRALAAREAQRPAPENVPDMPSLDVSVPNPSVLISPPSGLPSGVGIPLPTAIPPVEGIIIPFPAQKPPFGVVRPLQETPVGTQLLGRKRLAPPDPAAHALFDRGLPPPPRAGRNDDFIWR